MRMRHAKKINKNNNNKKHKEQTDLFHIYFINSQTESTSTSTDTCTNVIHIYECQQINHLSDISKYVVLVCYYK